MTKSIVLLVPLVFVVCVREATNPQSLPGVMRPVKQVPNPRPSTSEIEFDGFEFEQLFITHHPGTKPIEGEPTRGARFFVEARLYGEEAIATAKFEAVDEAGNVIQKILINRQPGPGGDSEFYGVMKVPDRPFRVVVSGEGIDGKSYRLIHERLFKPTTQRKSAVVLPRGGTGSRAMKTQDLEALSRQYLDQMENDARNAGEMIVIPQTRVSNVMYGPYLSKGQHPLGVRITFDAEFSHDGYYNPELRLVPEYQNSEWRGRIEMTPLTGNIEPKPDEPGTPQVQPHLLAYGAGYLYRAGITYHFTAEFVPNYVIQNEKNTKLCIYHQKYKLSPNMETAWKEILASKAPTTYRLHIANTDFMGEIEGLDAQGSIYNSFVSEGAQDCGEQPTNRF